MGRLPSTALALVLLSLGCDHQAIDVEDATPRDQGLRSARRGDGTTPQDSAMRVAEVVPEEDDLRDAQVTRQEAAPDADDDVEDLVVEEPGLEEMDYTCSRVSYSLNRLTGDERAIHIYHRDSEGGLLYVATMEPRISSASGIVGGDKESCYVTMDAPPVEDVGVEYCGCVVWAESELEQPCFPSIRHPPELQCGYGAVDQR